MCDSGIKLGTHTDGLCVPWLIGKGIQAAKQIMILTSETDCIQSVQQRKASEDLLKMLFLGEILQSKTLKPAFLTAN